MIESMSTFILGLSTAAALLYYLDETNFGMGSATAALPNMSIDMRVYSAVRIVTKSEPFLKQSRGAAGQRGFRRDYFWLLP